MSILQYVWMFATATTPPPTGSQLRFDAPDPYTAVSQVFLANVTVDGFDVHAVLLALPVGTSIYVQDKDDSTRFVRVTTIGTPIDSGGFVTVPVEFAASAGVLPAQQVGVFLITTDPIPTPPTGGGGLLVTLQQAKDHLYITRPAGDPDDVNLQRQIEQASGIIVDYLKSRADQGWLDGTVPVPVPVQTATLYLVAHLDRHRGDDMSEVGGVLNDQEVWNAIFRVLARMRDPALA